MSIIKALDFLSRGEVFLASGSPRRRELFQKLNAPVLSHIAIPEDVENLNPLSFQEPKDYVLANVKNKIAYAYDHILDRRSDSAQSEPIPQSNHIPSIIIAADTVVVDGKEILEKPKSPDDNFRMIKQISGKDHKVITAVSFIIPDSQIYKTFNGTDISLKLQEAKSKMLSLAWTFAVETQVRFMNLEDDMIKWYVDSGEGHGKAGGYAIQGYGAGLIESIHGCYYNVVGFPVNRFLVELNNSIETPTQYHMPF